ncbi:CapA family protein [Nocardioides sp.]|uniref:CapA family protein n=1 Tax=Nocardioides sp. TaxID=35761 RepID=UPI003D111FC0
MRRALAYSAVLGALSLVSVLLRGVAPQSVAPPASLSSVEVVGVDVASGQPLAATQATVLSGSGAEDGPGRVAGADGRVDLVLSSPRLVRVGAPGFLSRVVAIGPGDPVRVPLTPATDQAVSLRFGGDVMMGRRFYRPAHGPALLSHRATVADHARVLSDLRPMLADADLTVVNLETPLVERPWEADARGARFHPDKDLMFASGPRTAGGLAAAGVDVVDLANNHVYDALEAGIDSTVSAVEDAGLAHFGAGRTVEEAWAPAYVEVRGQVVAFVGCTTIDGSAHEITYVADDDKGGAARCDRSRLLAAIGEARSRADDVVFMLHGGVEYRQRQTPDVLRFSRMAARAGASVVVDGHPHVIGGITRVAGVPIVHSVGNLAFDQELWSSSRSYLVTVVLAAGKALSTVVDPIAIVDYRPVPVVGGLADSIDEVATSLAPGAADPAGRDLLWGTGAMEDLDTVASTTEPTLWALGKYAESSPLAACSGDQGLRLQRSPVSREDVTATTVHRQSIAPGTRLTLTAEVRQASAGASLEIRWYRGMAGGSSDVVSVPIPEQGPRKDCTKVSFDVVAPPGRNALQVYARLAPPHDVHLAAELLIDDLQLVARDD